MAIGDGGRMSIVADPRCCGSDVMVPDVNGEYPSSRLSAILKAEGVAKQGLILKVDCEGGERWLVDDSDLDEWMKGCIYFAAEFHETPSNPKTAWKEWLARVFGRHCVKEFLIGPYRNMMIYYYTMEKGSIQ